MNRPGDKAKHRSLDDWLGDMRRDANLVVTSTDDVTFEQFAQDVKLQDHVVRRLTNVGEAAKYVGQFFPEYTQQVTAIPWRDLARTRDVLTHAYFGIDLRLVWNMARKEMPEVRGTLDTVMENRKNIRAIQAGRGTDPTIK